MFTVSVDTHFRASHQLTLPDGSKESEHEHDWLVTAELGSDKLDRLGFVMDFKRLKGMVNDIVAQFDNLALERVLYFQQNCPSAENVAKYIYEALERELPKNVKLQNIKVIEQPGCSAKFGNYSAHD